MINARPALVSVPSLDEIARDPALVGDLPPHTVAALYGHVARIEADLRARLLAIGAEGHAPASEPDRALSMNEAATMLDMSKDFLYRQWASLGLGYKDADGHVKFSLSKVQRHIKARAGR